MADPTGHTLGPYRILEMIGGGGMADVYKAYQPAMDRYVAIKVIKPEKARDSSFLQRFLREGRAGEDRTEAFSERQFGATPCGMELISSQPHLVPCRSEGLSLEFLGLQGQ